MRSVSAIFGDLQLLLAAAAVEEEVEEEEEEVRVAMPSPLVCDTISHASSTLSA